VVGIDDAQPQFNQFNLGKRSEPNKAIHRYKLVLVDFRFLAVHLYSKRPQHVLHNIAVYILAVVTVLLEQVQRTLVLLFDLRRRLSLFIPLFLAFFHLLGDLLVFLTLVLRKL